MKFSEAWLRQWVDPPATSEELAYRLTMAGLELDGIEPAAPVLDGVLVAYIASLAPHPDADRLQVCQVDRGDGQLVSVVCGAPNARAGLKVALATEGARLPNGTVIKSAKLRGVMSGGMLCSAAELGLSEDSQGIIELDNAFTIGQSLTDALQLDDKIFEVDLTPNRADCLSIQGVAREVSALYQMPLTEPDMPVMQADSEDIFEVVVKDTQSCPRYCGRVIRAVNTQASTPAWMQECLRRSGIRSISITVDICNYVMLELGQPMHAFDLSRLDARIEVRKADDGEKLALLDGKEVTLTKDNLVIADATHVLALAGIMGGLNSAVTAETADIFLESAFFSPLVIAGKARSFGLHTDSSHRFERGVDPQLAPRAIERATQLIKQYAGGTVGPVIEVSTPDYLPEQTDITLDVAKVTRMLGLELTADEVKSYLESLAFKVETTNQALFQVTPPSYRFDIALDVDLIEEIARIRGYDAMPTEHFPAAAEQAIRPDSGKDAYPLQQGLAGLGYNEAVTFSFTEQKYCQAFSQAVAKTLANPISSELATMRTSIWPGLCLAANYNLKRQHSSVRLFEVGRKYESVAGGVKQIDVIAGIAVGEAYPRQWALPSRGIDFFDVKGDITHLCSSLALDGDLRFERSEVEEGLHPGKTAKIYLGEHAIGRIGVLHPSQAKLFELQGQEVVLFELLLNNATTCTRLNRFELWSKYPQVRRDLSLIVDQGVEVQTLVDTIHASQVDALKEVVVFAVYDGKGVPEGSKSVSLGLILQDFSSTLTDEKVEQLIINITTALASSTGAQLRS